MKFRTMALAAAGLLASAAVAQAQPQTDPNAPPAPPPPAAPADPNAPAAPPPAATPPAPTPPPAAAPATDNTGTPPPPAAQPDAPGAIPPVTAQPEPPPGMLPTFAPPPQPALTFGPSPSGADAVTPAATEKKLPNPWTYSWLTWTQAASAKILGVGRDYISTDDEVYSWDFTLTPRYAFVNTFTDQVYVNASVGVQVELTNSDTTQYEHQWLLKDSLIGVGWAHVAYESKDGEWKSTPGVSAAFLLPTSQASNDEGKYFTSSLGLSARQIVKLRGQNEDWFPNVLVIGAANWQHLFAKSYDPVNADLDRPRQDATGATILSDQLSMSSFNEDQLKFSFIYYLTIWKDLSFGNAWALAVPFKHQFSPSQCVNTSTGCSAAEAAPFDPTYGVPVTSFDVSLSYSFFDVARLDVGYNNEAPELGYDGLRQSVFYSPSTAQFYLDAVAYLDGIYDKATEKKKNAAALLPHRGINY